MDKRDFLKTSVIGVVGLIGIPAIARGALKSSSTAINIPVYPNSNYIAGNYLSAKSYQMHYTRYLNAANNLKSALKNYSGEFSQIKDILKNAKKFTPHIIENASIYLNHKVFLKLFNPAATVKTDINFIRAIDADFGSFSNFKIQFEKIAFNAIGNGWIWLVQQNNSLRIVHTKNNNSPFISELPTEQQGYPLMGLDLNEEAYSIDYENNIDGYINGYWSELNWEFISKRYHRSITLNS